MKRDLSTKQPHRIGWVRGSSRFPAGPQRKILEAAGVTVINGEVRMKGEVLASRRKNYATAGRKLRDGALSIVECKRVWLDVHKVLTDDEAASLCGVSKRTLLRWFGSSGRKAGWPKRVRRTKS